MIKIISCFFGNFADAANVHQLLRMSRQDVRDHGDASHWPNDDNKVMAISGYPFPNTQYMVYIIYHISTYIYHQTNQNVGK